MLNKVLNYFVFIMLGFSVPCLFGVFHAAFIKGVNFNDFKNVLFLILCFAIIALVLIVIAFNKNDSKIDKKFILFVSLLLANLLFRFFNMDITSGDYRGFLSNWVDEYRGLSLKECFSSKVGNYSPPYNYFLILISRIPLSDLYMIKLISFVFEILCAYFITKLVSYIKKDKFNIFLFLIVLSFPVFLINSCPWGQCDSIYTFFSFMAIYFAILGKSKSSFCFFGFSLCFKFQSIILFPVAFVLLLVKNKKGEKLLKWRDIWVAFVTYFGFTGISMLFGKSFSDAFLIYFEQSVTYNLLSSNCPNVAYLFNFFDSLESFKYVLMCCFIVVTLSVVSYLILNYVKKRNLSSVDIVNLSFLMTFFIVLFMPKMLDRYFYLSNIFALVLMCVIKDKVYFKLILLTLINSFIAHVGFTGYYYNTYEGLVIYSACIALFIASVFNSVAGVIMLFKSKSIMKLN